jgi:hypothetical protein
MKLIDSERQKIVEAMKALNALVDGTLFGAKRDWPADPIKISRIFHDLGLEESCGVRATRSTKLGAAVSLNLYMVFVGVWEPADIPLTLPDGLFTDEDANELWDRMEEKREYWDWLRPRIQSVYRSHYGQLRAN